MRLTAKIGVPTVLANFHEAFIGHLNAPISDMNARTEGSYDWRGSLGSFITNRRLTLREGFAKSCLSHSPFYEGKIRGASPAFLFAKSFSTFSPA